MPDSTYTELFHFASAALPPETFHVVRFRGTEGLNRLFSFSIDLVSQDSSVDADKVLDAPALFTIHRHPRPSPPQQSSSSSRRKCPAGSTR